MRKAILIVLTLLASPPAAAAGIETLVSRISPAKAAEQAAVELTFLNSGPAIAAYEMPQRISAWLFTGNRRIRVALERQQLSSSAPALAGGAFARGRYAMRLPPDVEAGQSVILSLDGMETGGFAFAISGAPANAGTGGAEMAGTAAANRDPADPVRPHVDSGNAFLANLSAYQPIYAVYGPGTNSDARLQISFKYQLFGEGGAIGDKHGWLDGIHFAFTERLFWDLGRRSSPFRNVDYVPEFFYLLAPISMGSGISLTGQAGFRHESNGREGAASRSFNTLYVQPVARMPVADYVLSIGPRLQAYVGRRRDNPDIADYRGHLGLFAEIGKDDGLRISTNSRFNIGTGKGAIDAEASYPLDRLLSVDLKLYLFGQAFAGYGENLLDYDKRTTRARRGRNCPLKELAVRRIAEIEICPHPC